jgi:uncharacterized protein (DUF433 family)
MSSSVERIVRDKEICGGEPIIQGTRVTVRDIVEYMELYGSEERILQALPDLTHQDITAALEYYRQHSAEIESYRQEEEESEGGEDVPHTFRRNMPLK